MRFMVIVKATKESEAGALPDPNSWPTWASSTKSSSRPASCSPCDGLQPSSKGARVKFSGKDTHRHRRPLRRNQGTRRRLLDLAGQIHGRGHRMDQTLPQPPRRRIRTRNPPGLRNGRFRAEFTPEEVTQHKEAASRPTNRPNTSSNHDVPLELNTISVFNPCLMCSRKHDC